MFDTVIQLEKSLLEPILRSDLSILQKLLHDEFVEFGQSGKIYNKQDIIDTLPNEESRILEVESTSITTRKLSDNCILLTYNLISDGKLHSRRSSIWIKNLDKWQLIFHQGTPC
jgi:hypothetical protein